MTSSKKTFDHFNVCVGSAADPSGLLQRALSLHIGRSAVQTNLLQLVSVSAGAVMALSGALPHTGLNRLLLSGVLL